MIFKFEKLGIGEWQEYSDEPGRWNADGGEIVAYILEYLVLRSRGKTWTIADIERVERRLKDDDKV